MLKPINIGDNYFVKLFEIDELTEWTLERWGRPNPMIINMNPVQLIISDHHCYECGFVGRAPAASGKVECPSCETVNDLWMRGHEST